MISPAMSLLKVTVSPVPREEVPVSWSPLVKMMVSGAGAAGACAGHAAIIAQTQQLRETPVVSAEQLSGLAFVLAQKERHLGSLDGSCGDASKWFFCIYAA